MPRALRPPLLATLAFVVLAAAWWVQAGVAARSKTASLPATAERLDVAITLNFPPEAFHLQQAQELGQLVGVEGPVLHVREARREALVAFARNYWVGGIRAWSGP